jgi:hypothetical protein
MIFIISKNNNILTICDSLDCVYHNILTYCRIILYCDKNKINYFDDLKIIKYENGIPTQSYYVNTNTLNICDENNNKIILKNDTIQRNKIELEILLRKDVESDINFIIPLEFNKFDNNLDNEFSDEDYSNQNIYIKQNQPIQIDQPSQTNQPNQPNQPNQSNQPNQPDKEKQIKLLKAKIALETIKLEKNNLIYDKKINKYLEKKHKIGLIEKKLKLKKEKEEEKKRIFIVDRNTFNRLINEINNNERDIDDIPLIFKNKFIIFQQLKSEYESESDYQNIDELEQYEKYIKIEKELNLQKINIDNDHDNMFASNSIYDKLYNDLKNINTNNSEFENSEFENSENSEIENSEIENSEFENSDFENSENSEK